MDNENEPPQNNLMEATNSLINSLITRGLEDAKNEEEIGEIIAMNIALGGWIMKTLMQALIEQREEDD